MSSRRQRSFRAASPRGRSAFALAGSVDFAAAKAGDAEGALPRFHIIAYTGEPMELAGWRLPVVIDIAGMSVGGRKRPVLRDHDPRSVVGHTETIVKQRDRLEATGVISGAGEAAREILASGRNSFPWQASIGGRAKQVIEVREGRTARANGREYEGPIYLARTSELAEISFVALGADGDTEARVLAAQLGGLAMNFEAWVASLGLEVENLAEPQRAALEKRFRALAAAADGSASGGPDDEDESDEPPPSANGRPRKMQASDDAGTDGSDKDDDPPASEEAARSLRAAAAAEARRIAAVEAKTKGHPEIRARAIEHGWSATRAELEVLRATLPKAPAVAGAGQADVPVPHIYEASLLLQHGVSEQRVGQWYEKRVMEAALSARYRHVGLSNLVFAVCEAQGRPIRGGRLGAEELRIAERCELQAQQSAGFAASVTPSTVSLQGVLGNVMHKILLDAFLAVPRTTPLFCATGNLNDFKVHTRYRMTGDMRFEKVGKSGEIKDGGLTEESFTNQLDTYAKLLCLTRKDVVNDDLGAFLDVPRHMGRGAALAIELEAFRLLLSNPGNFFDAANGNYFEGATSSLGIDSLTTAEQKFLDQVDSAGNPISLTPAILLVPTSLKVLAEQLYKDTQIVTGSTGKNLSGNPHSGKFQPVASPYLNNSAIPGSSTTAWYLLADPASEAVMEIGYLRGQQAPTIEPIEPAGNILGVAWRGYHDFGVAMREPRAGVKSKGAA